MKYIYNFFGLFHEIYVMKYRYRIIHLCQNDQFDHFGSMTLCGKRLSLNMNDKHIGVVYKSIEEFVESSKHKVKPCKNCINHPDYAVYLLKITKL